MMRKISLAILLMGRFAAAAVRAVFNVDVEDPL